MSKLIAFFILLGALPLLASAHGDAIEQGKTVGTYETTLEYESIGNPLAGESTSFSFELSRAPGGESANFDRVFVTVSQKDGPVVFLANISALDVEGIKTSRARIFLPQEGDYEFKLEYYLGNTELVENTFTVPADPTYASPESSDTGFWPWLAVAALFVGLVTGSTLKKRI